ncbi:MAG TPA: hypothetical protein VJL33_05345 [Candidatus Bathyarchaeia archaeon]|nr:hypothetical protein [Candidatus Bathyarchaeia archaeon]
MNHRDKFGQDLNTLTTRLTSDMLNEDAKNNLVSLKDWLLQLQKENVVKINHSVMELVCAKYLIQKGYDVQIEHVLNELLTCDLYSTKGYGNLIVEVETGFIPPDHALDPLTYLSARLASKIIRYSSFAGKFALGVPPHYVLHFPRALASPPRRRTTADIEFIKKLCDTYYQNPPVTEEEIRNARIQEIYIIDVDRVKVLAIDPEAYMKRALHKEFAFAMDGEREPRQSKPASLFDYEGKSEETA